MCNNLANYFRGKLETLLSFVWIDGIEWNMMAFNYISLFGFLKSEWSGM